MELALAAVSENYDKDNPGKLKVKLKLADTTGNETLWLPMLAPYAGGGYGMYWLPEKEDTVIVGFINGDPQSGVVLGALWTKKNALPDGCAAEKNETKKFITKCGHQIMFDDKEKGGISIKTKKELEIVISDDTETITLKDKNGRNKITVNAKDSKLQLDAEKEICIKCDKTVTIDGDITLKGKDIKLEATSGLTLKGKTVKIEGTTIKAEGSASTEVKGASVKVESSGILTLKGSMTKIN